MRKILIGFIFLFQLNASAESCKAMFSESLRPAVAKKSTKYKRGRLNRLARKLHAELESPMIEMETRQIKRLRRWATVNKWLKSASGNKFEPMTRQMRTRLGDRVTKLIKASSYRALNYTRDIWQNTRTAAGLLLYYQIRVYKIEMDLVEGKYVGKEVTAAKAEIKKLTKRAYKEAKKLNRYGDFEMIIGKLLAYRQKYSKDANEFDKVRQVLDQSQREVSVAQLETVVPVEVRVGRNLGGLKSDQSVKDKTSELLQSIVNDKVKFMAQHGSGIFLLRNLFPEMLFLKDDIAKQKKSEDEIDFLLRKEGAFVKMVYEGSFFKDTGYRPVAVEAPLLYTIRRDVAWEAVAVIKNNISAAFQAYASLFKAIDSSALKAILSKRIKERAESSDTEVANKAKSLINTAENFNTLDIKFRKAIHWTLDSLSIPDAKTIHAKKMEYIEELVGSPKGLVKNKEIIEALGHESISQPGFLLAFARTRDYRESYRKAQQAVRDRIEEIRLDRKSREEDSWESKKLLREMDEAWLLVSKGDVKEISLIDEPSFVSKLLNQSVYVAAPALTIISIWTMIDPVGAMAFAQLLPGLF